MVGVSVSVHQQTPRDDVSVMSEFKPDLCVQDQYEKALSGLQQRVQELETKLKGVQVVLQEKVQQLKEQVSSTAGLMTTWPRQRCISHYLFVWSSAGEEHKVEQLVEGSVCAKCSTDDSTASHRTAAEKCREEELPLGGKGQRPQQAAERCCSCGPRHMTPPLWISLAEKLGWSSTSS